jgi:hypothetical protein
MSPVPAAPAPFRLARGIAVALVGLTLAVTAHGIAATGSPLPPASPLLALVVLAVVAGCVVASSHRWTPARLVLVLSGVQVAVHGTLWLESGSGAVDPRLAGLAVAHGSHVHGSTVTSPPMLAAHAAAVLVATALLARIDDAVVLLVALARLLVVRLAPVLAAPAAAALGEHRRPAVLEMVGLGSIARRGPPARVAFG